MDDTAVGPDPRTVANMDLVGGRPVVDLVNTVSDRATERPHDRLGTFGDFLEWAVRVGMLEREAADRLGASAAERPAEAAAALGRAKELREALFDLFRSAALGGEPDARSVAVLNGVLTEGMRNRAVRPAAAGFEWSWDGSPERLDAVLWPLALSAAELLTGDEIGRLKECDADGCRWIFLDLSRNRSRRWCTMEDCGNRAKARRHYHRHRA